MATCFDVADYFLSKVCQDEDFDDIMTHLKLQKLVYYAQGFTLAITGKQLFGEPIVAWDHGPVTPDLYQTYKEYGKNPIPALEPGVADARFDKEQLEILEEVHELYGQFSAWKLRNLTHSEPTWDDAYPNGVIEHEAMETYFKTLLV
jgi:uncharacterized phage-associated protein